MQSCDIFLARVWIVWCPTRTCSGYWAICAKIGCTPDWTMSGTYEWGLFLEDLLCTLASKTQ